jgi:hypothetical protein
VRLAQKKAATKLLGLFFGWFRREGFGLFDEQRESSGVFHRDVSENFAVEFDSGGFEAVNQLTVSETVQTSSRADALNPEPAVLTLLYAAIAERIAIGALLARTDTACSW